MNLNFFKQTNFFAVLTGLILLFLGLSGTASAQKVRLRSQITPACTRVRTTNVGLLPPKFSDIYADGNIAVQGGYDCNGVFIYDITNPDAPVLANVYNPGNSQQFLEAIVIGNRGYFGSGNTSTGVGVHIVDLTNPYNPVLLGTVDPTHGNGHVSVHEMIIWGNYLIENSNSSSIRTIKIINISNPANPVFLREFTPTTGAWAHAMNIRGNRLYLSGLDGRLEIYDVAGLIALNSGSPIVIPESATRYHSTWNYDGIVDATSEQKLIFANGYIEFTVSVNANETSKGERRFGLAISKNTEYTNFPLSFAVRKNPDTTYTGEIVENSSIKLSFSVINSDILRISTEAGVVKYYKNGQLIYTSQQVLPTVSGSPNLLVTPLLIKGTIFHRNTSINEAKISNTSVESVIWKTVDNQITIAGNTFTKTLGCDDCNYMYSCREISNGDVRVYDVSNLSQPATYVFRITAGDLGLNAFTPHNPVVMGNKLYVAWYQSGLQVFDLTNPAQPTRIGQFDTFQPAFAPTEEEKQILDNKSDEVICGSFSSSLNLASGYDGAWAIYPFLGEDKVLTGDLTNGLQILDVTKANSPLKNVVSDFDSDGKTDYSVYTPSTGTWKIEQSSNNAYSETNFGLSDDKIVTGDYDGDGKADIAIFRPSTGTWWIRRSSNPGSFLAVNFGANGDVPVEGDYDADGKTDIAVFRPSTGVWYILQSTLGIRIQTWGVNGDKAFTGDYEGDGKADLVIFRPSTGVWYILQSSSNIALIAKWGVSTDTPLSGDFDGDGKADLAVFRPSEGNWYILNSFNTSVTIYHFGSAGDIPIPSDFDNDSKADFAVFRPSENIWYRLDSSNGAFSARIYGQTGDTPSPTANQPQ